MGKATCSVWSRAGEPAASYFRTCTASVRPRIPLGGCRIGSFLCTAFWIVGLVYGFHPAADAVDDPWADAVVESHLVNPPAGFDNPLKVLGAPTGGGTYAPNQSGVCSLGSAGGYITVRFNTPVEDDPLNPLGLDFIIFGNAFWVGGDPQRRFMEAALVEVSEDVNGNGIPDDPWYVIPGSRGIAQGALPGGIPNPSPPLAGSVYNANAEDANPANDTVEYTWGYADCTPTQIPCRDNYLRPDNPQEVGLTPKSGGGDAFDIAWAVDSLGQPAHLPRIHFIRVWSFIQGSMPGLGDISPEIDAFADVAPLVDTDGDGLLDEYETRAAGTDPLRPESTVLPLEIPPEDGGSPAGTLLGKAEAADGTALRLYSSGPRTGTRPFNTTVDIVAVAPPSENITGYIKSGACRRFDSTVADFAAAQVSPAVCTLAYTAADIVGLDETSLTPWRYAEGVFTQEGIANVTVDTILNRVYFQSRYSGTFVLAGQPGSGDIGGTPGVPVGPVDVLPLIPNQTVPGTLWLTTDTVRDANGAVVPHGTLLTVQIVDGGTLATPDAAPSLPGHQIAVINGVALFSVQATGSPPQGDVTVRLYRDATLSVLLADKTLTFPYAPPTPLPLTPVSHGALIALLLYGGWALLQRVPRPQPRSST